jgi:phosphatidate cytidylyltransferase
MLKQRVLTAIILASVIICAVIFLPTKIFALLLASIICVGAWEWTTCVGFDAVAHKIAYVSVIFLCMMACLLVLDKPWVVFIIACGLAWWLLATYLVIYYQTNMTINLASSALKATIGGIIFIPSWLSLVLIHAKTTGTSLILFLFFLIWLADSAAYFSGKKFGNKKLANNVSPGKSWEGVYGALFLSLLFGAAYAIYVDMKLMAAILFITLTFFTVSFSIIGDLVESMFKRMADIKDSSQLLPGHGGVLDRIDSLTSAAPVFFAGLWVIERIL